MWGMFCESRVYSAVHVFVVLLSPTLFVLRGGADAGSGEPTQ